MHNFIFGEESNLFTLPNGETMVVSIGPTPSDTIRMLSRLLSDRLARVLGDAIHEETRASLREEVRERVRRLNYLKERQLGMWIDPLGMHINATIIEYLSLLQMAPTSTWRGLPVSIATTVSIPTVSGASPFWWGYMIVPLVNRS